MSCPPKSSPKFFQKGSSSFRQEFGIYMYNNISGNVTLLEHLVLRQINKQNPGARKPHVNLNHTWYKAEPVPDLSP